MSIIEKIQDQVYGGVLVIAVVAFIGYFFYEIFVKPHKQPVLARTAAPQGRRFFDIMIIYAGFPTFLYT